MTRARVGIVGCGDVTNLYLPGCALFPVIELAACADLDPVRAAVVAERAGIPAVSVEDLLRDPSIEIVLNLTPPKAHAAVSLAAIAAGKHVYTEKPLATSRDDAQSVLGAAAAAGVRVGGAPDTFLGAGFQTTRELIEAGAIGRPDLAVVTFAHHGPEHWHPNPDIFYASGGGPLLDVGPYSIAALVELLGPVAQVSAMGIGGDGTRQIATGPRAGEIIPVEVPTSVVATLRFVSGAIASLTASFDVVASTAPRIAIHGESGSIEPGDPNEFDDIVRLRRRGDDSWQEVPFTAPTGMLRGVGLADMIEAIRADRPHRASGDRAFHTLDVLLSLEESVASGAAVDVRVGSVASA